MPFLHTQVWLSWYFIDLCSFQYLCSTLILTGPHISWNGCCTYNCRRSLPEPRTANTENKMRTEPRLFKAWGKRIFVSNSSFLISTVVSLTGPSILKHLTCQLSIFYMHSIQSQIKVFMYHAKKIRPLLVNSVKQTSAPIQLQTVLMITVIIYSESHKNVTLINFWNTNPHLGRDVSSGYKSLFCLWY